MRETFMRVGILTFHRANNFGAFLQAFALCKRLNEMDNITAEIVDYICPAIENEYNPESLLNGDGNKIKKKIVYFLRKPVMEKTAIKFESARKKYLPISKRNIERNDLKDISSLYDLFIVGSDQVWNQHLTGNDKTYFLDFIEDRRKKGSYAVSMGDPNYDKDELIELKRNLKDFSFLSVREKNTAAYLNKITERDDIVVSVDPVFLLARNEWIAQMQLPEEKDYVLFYTVGNPRTSTLNFAKELAKEKKKKLLFIRDRDIAYKHLEVKHINGIDPLEFVGYIFNASDIVTNSFHATAFSVLLHKNFYVETKMKRNERMLNLLDTAGIRGHKLFDGSLTGLEQDNINWSAVDDKLKSDIALSLNYLENIAADFNKGIIDES